MGQLARCPYTYSTCPHILRAGVALVHRQQCYLFMLRVYLLGMVHVCHLWRCEPRWSVWWCVWIHPTSSVEMSSAKLFWAVFCLQSPASWACGASLSLSFLTPPLCLHQILRLYGDDAHLLTLRCLLEEIDFHDHKSQKDHFKLQLLSQVRVCVWLCVYVCMCLRRCMCACVCVSALV